MTVSVFASPVTALGADPYRPARGQYEAGSISVPLPPGWPSFNDPSIVIPRTSSNAFGQGAVDMPLYTALRSDQA